MSPVREKFIKAIEALPYNIDEEIFKKSEKEIIRDITKKYVEMYGIEELNESDKECIQSIT